MNIDYKDVFVGVSLVLFISSIYLLWSFFYSVKRKRETVVPRLVQISQQPNGGVDIHLLIADF